MSLIFQGRNRYLCERMNYRHLYTVTSRSLTGRLLLAIMAVMLCMTAIPHHHHGEDMVCVRADLISHSAESSSLVHCGACCVTRSLYYNIRSERTVVIQSVFLLSFLLSSVLIGKYLFRLFEKEYSWQVCRERFVSDEPHLSLFGWRAPPVV